MNDRVAALLEKPLVYRAWQAPFVGEKLAPVLRNSDGLASVRRILDVGCGPGTNAPRFAGRDYTGIDINPKYVDYARRRYDGRFEVADATTYEVDPDERFDFVLINSFLHHIPDDAVERILEHLSTVLTPDGHIHVIDMDLPEQRSLARTMSLLDRGDYTRPQSRWMELLSASFEPVVFEPFGVGAARWPATTIWRMIYFKGRAR